jgi:hypothetical protein
LAVGAHFPQSSWEKIHCCSDTDELQLLFEWKLDFAILRMSRAHSRAICQHAVNKMSLSDNSMPSLRETPVSLVPLAFNTEETASQNEKKTFIH